MTLPFFAHRFKTHSNLKTHMDTHEDTSYQCYVCNRVLNSRRTLRKHLLVHEEKCRHVCSYCHKAFKRRQTLKVMWSFDRVHARKHLLMHEEKCRYLCSCHMAFKRRWNLNVTHRIMRQPDNVYKYLLVHEGKWFLVCSYSLKAFIRRQTRKGNVTRDQLTPHLTLAGTYWWMASRVCVLLQGVQ